MSSRCAIVLVKLLFAQVSNSSNLFAYWTISSSFVILYRHFINYVIKLLRPKYLHLDHYSTCGPNFMVWPNFLFLEFCYSGPKFLPDQNFRDNENFVLVKAGPLSVTIISGNPSVAKLLHIFSVVLLSVLWLRRLLEVPWPGISLQWRQVESIYRSVLWTLRVVQFIKVHKAPTGILRHSDKECWCDLENCLYIVHLKNGTASLDMCRGILLISILTNFS